MRLFTLLTLFVLVKSALGQTNSDLEFATYLFNTQNFRYSAEECERVIFIDQANDSAKTLLLKSYSADNRASFAVRRGSELFPTIKSKRKEFTIEWYKSALKASAYDTSLSITLFETTFNTQEQLDHRLTSFLLLNRSAKADSLLRLSTTPLSKELALIFSESRKTRIKSPVVAAALSTAVPGLGKVYSGFWRDGMISFIAIAGPAFQAYRGFSRNGINSAYGWVFGSLALGFYSGNIWGSYASAKKHNEKKRKEYVQKITDAYSDHY